MSGATLNLGGFSNTIGSLAGTGTVTDTGAGGDLSAGGNNTSTTFSGVLHKRRRHPGADQDWHRHFDLERSQHLFRRHDGERRDLAGGLN